MTAPDFEIRLHSGLRFRLSDNRGERNVVLFFFPREGTWTGTREVEVFARHMKDLESYDAVLLGVNNAQPEEHRTFAEQNRLPIYLGSDPELEVCRNYRVLWLGSKAIRRVTYIIDKNLIVQGVAHHELLVERHWTHVRRVLETLGEESRIASYNRKAHNL